MHKLPLAVGIHKLPYVLRTIALNKKYCFSGKKKREIHTLTTQPAKQPTNQSTNQSVNHQTNHSTANQPASQSVSQLINYIIIPLSHISRHNVSLSLSLSQSFFHIKRIPGLLKTNHCCYHITKFLPPS